MAKTDVNSVVLIGNLTRDADVSFTPSGTSIVKLSIAVNRAFKRGEEWVDEVSYFDVNLWGSTGLHPYLKKGKKIAVQGYLKQDRWEKDGQKNSRVVIVSENVQLLSPSENNNAGGNNNQQYFQPQQQNNNQQKYYQPKSYQLNVNVPNQAAELAQNFGGTVEADDGYPEDIPF